MCFEIAYEKNLPRFQFFCTKYILWKMYIIEEAMCKFQKYFYYEMDIMKTHYEKSMKFFF